MSQLPRSEYPRPQFVRDSYLSLNGEWEFSFDEPAFDQKIIVPYAYQTKLSGIHSNEAHDTVWYQKRFDLPEEMEGKRILLHFGAVDYQAKLWVNDQFVTEHIGGHIGFEVEITDLVATGENEIRLEVYDPVTDLEMPRGKQYWKPESASIFYTRTTGIWQSVWLEAVSETYLRKVWLTPDLDTRSIGIRYELDRIDSRMNPEPNAKLGIEISYEGTTVVSQVVDLLCDESELSVQLDQQRLLKWQAQEEMIWTPEKPRLFDIRFAVTEDGETVDEVDSYFGLRKISIENGKLLLNNRPYYQKLLLDQGYWRDGLLTAPTDEDFVTDIRLSKEMGFNGVRKHQKIEDPRFLYHADKMGFLVWGELPAAYVYSRKYVKRITDEWIDAIFRDYNHPSIVAWTPINESWGVVEVANDEMQQYHTAAMVSIAKSLDRTRPVISNDGWEHTMTDLLTIHDYEGKKDVLLDRYKDLDTILDATPAGRMLYANGWSYNGEPILVTEFGGISYQKDEQEGWGYTSASSDEDFAKRYNAVISAMLESPLIQGFCYTQITDVEQEINGLLTYDREPKIDPAIIKAINEGRYEE